jgi:hypothetical protein
MGTVDTESTPPLKREILLCGGPHRGEWVEVPIHSSSYYAAKFAQPRMSLLSDGPPEMAMESHRYDIQPITTGDRQVVWVGIHQDVNPSQRERAIARELFQRDVYARVYGLDR